MCITSLFWRTNSQRNRQRIGTGLYIHLMKWCMNGMLATDKEGDKESFYLSVTIRVHYISSSWSSHKRTQHPCRSSHPFCATPKTTFIRRWRTNWRIYLLIPDSWRAINGMRRCCCCCWWVLYSSWATGNGWILSRAIRSGPVLALLILTSRVKWEPPSGSCPVLLVVLYLIPYRSLRLLLQCVLLLSGCVCNPGLCILMGN